MGIDQFILSLKDSEGGDYVRVYSKYHQCEFYIHKDTQITPISNIWCEELCKPGYKVVITGHLQDGSEPFFVASKNCEWYCGACANRGISCSTQYVRPTECEDCKLDREENGI